MRLLLVFLLYLGVWVHSVRAGPPTPAEVEELLRREPLDRTTWSRWSSRLREWSAESFESARPAFQAGYRFILPPGGLPLKRPAVAKGLNADAVAWMLLAEGYLDASSGPLGQASAGARAVEAARRSVRLDARLARAHFYLHRGLLIQGSSPENMGGTSRPNVSRLREAVEALQRARTLAPRVRWVEPEEAGKLAIQAQAWDRAETYLREALEESPSNPEVARRLGQAIYHRGGADVAVRIAPLTQRFPQEASLAVFHAHALAREGRPDAAEDELSRARSLGTDPSRVVDPQWVKHFDQERARNREEAEARNAEAERRRRQREVTRHYFHTLGRGLLLFLGFYGFMMAVMCLLAWWLAPKAGTEFQVSRFYLGALLTGLVLFYAALPVLFVGMVVVFLPLFGLALLSRSRQGEGALTFDLIQASGGSLMALVRAMFAGSGRGRIGLRKTREDCPALFAEIETVARRVGTDPPDVVWLAPGADFWVRQEGWGPFGLFGARQRVLTLGLCVFHFLTVSELRGILAHELAHFRHADTFWHRFVFQVSLSLRTAQTEMARTGGWVTWGNPFYWFFWAYSRSFNMLAAGFSRGREYRADQVGCDIAGSDVFVNGLRKVCTVGTHFEQVIEQNIARLLRTDQAFINIYLAFRKYWEGGSPLVAPRLHQELEDASPSMFASHPTFRERVEAAGRLPVAEQTDDRPALALFEQAEEVERELTDFLTHCAARSTPAHWRLSITDQARR